MTKNFTLLALAATACVITANPSLAQDFDFSGAESVGNSLLDWFRGNLANLVLTLVLVIAGFLAAFNQIRWSWFFAVALGAFVIFSAPRLVSWLATTLS